MRRLAAIAHPTPAPFLLRGNWKTANEVDHFALLVRQKLPFFPALDDDLRGLEEIAAVLVFGLAFNISGDAHLTFFIVENRVTEVVVAHHERASIPAAVLLYRDKGPPEDGLVVIQDRKSTR